MSPKSRLQPREASHVDFDSLCLDREGRWFHEGVEITHERTRLLFLRSLRKSPDGFFHIQVGKEQARVEVEDAPFLVRSVTAQEDGQGGPHQYLLRLNDETDEWLDPRTLLIGSEHVLYCTVKEGTARARFLRPAYYQLSGHVRHDEETGVYWLPWKQGKVVIHPDPDRGGED
jgi:uncharacterized protein